MKPLLFLALCALVPVATMAPASAAKRASWEYATLELGVSRPVGSTNQMNIYGADLHLPGRKPLFLRSNEKNYNSTAYKHYLLNKLGSQGWELVTVVGARGFESKYIFKRQK